MDPRQELEAFRRLNELEQKSRGPEPSFIDRTVSGTKQFFRDHGRDMAGAGGSVVGGILALPPAIAAGLPTMGVGGVATEMAGVGLGNAIGTQLYDRFTQRRQTLPAQVKTAAQDVSVGALSVPAGAVIGKTLSAMAPVVAPAIRAAGNTLRAVSDVVPGSTTRANRLAIALRQSAEKSARQRASAAGAQAAEQQAKALLAEERASTLSGATLPPVSRIGQVRETPADIGAPLQRTAITEERNLIAQSAETDKVLRNTRDLIKTENEQNGVRITSVPTYQVAIEMLAGWKTALGNKAPDVSVQKVYQGILDRISPQKVELSPQEAQAAQKQGVKVIQEGQKLYREFDPSFDGIDGARRFLGDVFSGKLEGYGAIASREKQNLYSLLKNIEEEYVGKAQPRLQANWRARIAELADFETRIGKKLIGRQPGTDVPSQTPEAIANAAFGGSTKGAADYDQLVAALKGNERVARKAASDYVATALDGKSYADANRAFDKIRPMLKNEKLAALLQRTENYLANLKKAEEAASGARVATKEATDASVVSGRASAQESRHFNTITDLMASKSPKEGADLAMAYFKKLSETPVERGGITPDQYAKIRSDYGAINFSTPEAARAGMRKWGLRAARAAAIPVLTGAGVIGAQKIFGENSGSSTLPRQ